MQVFVVTIYNWQAYEGGGSDNLGVHSTLEGARQGLRKHHELWGNRKPFPKEDLQEDVYVYDLMPDDTSGDASEYRIESWDVET